MRDDLLSRYDYRRVRAATRQVLGFDPNPAPFHAFPEDLFSGGHPVGAPRLIMTHASKTGAGRLLGVAVLLCLGALLWLAPWGAAGREEGVEVVQRSVATTIGAQAGDELLPGVGSSEMRLPEQVSAEALAAARAAAALRDGSPPVVQLIGKVLGPAGEAVAGARVLVTTGRSAGSSLGMALEDRELRGVCSTESDSAGQFRIGTGEGIPELEEGRTVAALIRSPGWVVRSCRLGRFPGRRPMVAAPIVMEPAETITGRVLGPDGLPVEGATVYFGQASPLGGFRVSAPSRGYLLGMTPEEGTFRCDELAPGPFHLVVEKPGHPVAFHEGEVSAGRGLAGVVVRLGRGDSISGEVDSGDQPPADLWVSAWPVDRGAPAVDRRPRAVRPDAEGRFELEGLRAEGSYRVYVGLDRSPRSPMEGESTVSRSGEHDLRLVWRPRASVRGRVVHRSAITGALEPVERFVVWQAKGAPGDDEFDGRALTDERGEAKVDHPGGVFSIEGLRIGEGEQVPYTFRVRTAGYEQLVRRGVPMGHGAQLDLGDLELTPAPSLRVRVVEAGTDLSVEGARVYLAAASDRVALGRWRLRDRAAHSSDKIRFAETDPDGRAVLQLPVQRPWVLCANGDGFPAGELIVVTGDEEELTVELARGATLTAEVVDEDGNPLKGIDVSLRVRQSGHRDLWVPRRMVQSGEDGIARFEHVEMGEGVVRAELPRMRPRQPRDWSDTAEAVQIPASGEVETRLVMPVSGELRGRVRAGGRALPDARIRLAIQDGDELLRPETTSTTLRAITDTSGEFALRGLPTGTYEVTVNHRNRAMATVFTHQVGPEPEELLIDLAEATVSGRLVYRGSGEPVVGVSIKVRGPSDLHRAWVGQRTLRAERDGSMDARDDWLEPGSLRSGEDGSFAFGGLTVGVPVRLDISGSLVLGKRVNLPPFEAGEAREQVVIEVDAAASLTVVAGSSSGSGRRGRRARQYGIRLRGLDERGGVRSNKVVSRLRGSSYRFSSLTPGRYRVETVDLKAEGAPAVESKELLLEAGERATITMPAL